MWSPSPRHSVVSVHVALVVLVAVVAAPAAAVPLDKLRVHEEMIALARQIAALKADPVEAERVSRLLERYRQLSDSMGGDDPGALAGAAASPRKRSLVGDGGPPNCDAVTSTFDSTDVPVDIVDVAVVTSTLTVAGAGPFLWRVDAETFIAHTFAADLDVTLTSPAGTVVTLTTDNGAGNDDVFNGTVWTDYANPGGQVPYTSNDGLTTDHAYVNLTLASPLVPEEAMSAFVGEDPNGVWFLTISDDLGGDVGTLSDWSLTITSLAASPITTTSTISSADVPVAIPTGPAVVASTLDITELNTFLCDVNAETTIPHTFAADLDMTLASPAGTIITLTTDNGAGSDNVFAGTLWDDDANPGGQVPYITNDGLTTDHAYVNLTLASPLVPEEALGAFNGEDPNGTWALTISDDLAGDGGSIDAWSLEVTTCRCVETEVFSPVALAVDPAPLVSDGNGVFEPEETVEVAPSWRNDGMFAQTVSGAATAFTGPPGPEYTIVDDFADYGTVDPGAIASCLDTDMCYAMEVGPLGVERPAVHWDASFDETLSEESAATWTLHLGDSFLDVPRTHLFYPAVETLLHAGVSSEPLLARRDLLVLGCSETEFCPAAPNTRAEAAVFLLTGKEGGAFEPPPCTPDNEPFDDVPVESPFCPWIQELAERSVTAGCGGGNYCPDASVTRAQMAVFLLKTLEGPKYVPTGCSEVFDDVPCPSTFADWIEDLFTRGVTAGCSAEPTLYCPGGMVTRGQMASLVVKTFELALYGP